jgi:anti-sigma factor RsiW
MNLCDELAPLLAAHAGGDLAGEERTRIEAHLQSCEACRAEREILAETLELAALPAPDDVEMQALGAFAGQTRAAWRAQERTTRRDARFAFGGLAALAAAVLVALSVGRVPLANLHHRGALSAQVGQVAAGGSPSASSDLELALDDMADGPVEYASDDSASPLAFDPEVAPTVFSDEGDE